jgi:peptidoglycan hydrolase-like protein with peptidoglycan-binding domain
MTPVATIGAAQTMADTRPRPHGRRRHPFKIGMLVALTSGMAAAGTTFAAHASMASHRADARRHQYTARAVGSRRAMGPPAPLRVLSIFPGDSADPVTAANPVRVVFSAPLAPTSPLPTFSPAVPGSWHNEGGGTLVFTPALALSPGTEETLQIPAGRSGVRSVAGALLTTPVRAVFQAGGRSTLRLEQLLAQLGYLPLTWSPGSADGTAAASYTNADLVAAAAAAADTTGAAGAAGAPAGVLTWQSGYPAALTSQWQPGAPGVILTGALMAFQMDNGLPMTGVVTSAVWQALLGAAVQGQDNPSGYSFALVTKTQPETITVWHDGKIVMHGLANTGAAVTPTPDGTFPVYLRSRRQVMQGLMPNGEPYADPVQFVSFFHGDYAVHSMSRAFYGSPQSLGCVELPLSEARRVWPYLTYGTLVTVTV